MFWRQKDKAPYGWRSYRRNLIVLSETLSNPEKEVSALIEKTNYEEPGERPGPARQWADLNELELRIFRQLDDAQLVAEMERKFAQAKQSKLPGLSGLQKQFRAADGIGARAEAERKALAFVFLEEMFVKYSYRFADQAKRREVSRRLTTFGVLILGPVILGLVFGLAQKYFATHSSPPLFAWLEQLAIFVGPIPQEVAKAPLGLFFIVAYSGIVGAYFSRLFGYVSKMESLRAREMDVIYSWGALSVRLLVGAIGALILFFLMMGNLLQGTAFPEIDFASWRLDDTGKEVVPLQPSTDFAKLIVWSIVAGFFERFVPDRLESAKKRAESSGSSGGNQPAE